MDIFQAAKEGKRSEIYVGKIESLDQVRWLCFNQAKSFRYDQYDLLIGWEYSVNGGRQKRSSFNRQFTHQERRSIGRSRKGIKTVHN